MSSPFVQMIRRRAPKQPRQADRVIHFSAARLVLSTSGSGAVSYLELELDNVDCVYCDKTNPHDHEFVSRLRVEPKEGKYFVSLVKKREESKSNGLQITPVKIKDNEAVNETHCVASERDAVEILKKCVQGEVHVLPKTL